MHLEIQSCQYFISSALSTSSQLAYFGGLVMFVAILFRVIISLYKTHNTKSRLLSNKVPNPKKIAEICNNINVSLSEISVIQSDKLIAASIGILKPNIIVSNKVVNNLSKDELSAVLLHEAYHSRHHHSLFSLAASILQKVFVLFPVVDEISEHLSCKLECAADNHVITKQKTATHLKKAMRRFINDEGDTTSLLSITSLSNFAFNHLSNRIAAIQGKPVNFKYSSGKIFGSIISAVVIVGISIGGQSSFNTAAANNLRAEEQSIIASSQNCTLMSCVSECIQQRSATRQQSLVSVSLRTEAEMSGVLTE